MIARRELIISTAGGFPYLFAHGVLLLTAGLVSFAAPAATAALVYAAQAPLAWLGSAALGRMVGAPMLRQARDQRRALASIYAMPLIALPALLVVALQQPHQVPMVLAVVFAAHLLPLGWLLGSIYFVVGGVLVACVTALLYLLMGKGAFHFVGLVVGSGLIVASWFAYRFAERYTMRAGD